LTLIKRIARFYRYYLARLGRAAIAAACSFTQFKHRASVGLSDMTNGSPFLSALQP
jgi:hypothetical protein